MFANISFKIMEVTTDGLPQNMACWYIEYFKLKDFEKRGQEGHSDLLPIVLIETGHKTLG